MTTPAAPTEQQTELMQELEAWATGKLEGSGFPIQIVNEIRYGFWTGAGLFLGADTPTLGNLNNLRNDAQPAEIAALTAALSALGIDYVQTLDATTFPTAQEVYANPGTVY